MKIYLAETIKNLRLQKKMTQEQLADVFCVSPQAVSRWECGTTTPDITLLPVIADYFEVTMEELLGVEKSRQKAKRDEYLTRFDKAIQHGQINDCIEIARAGVRDFPNDYSLLNKLMYALFAAGDEGGNIPDWKENMETYKYEIIELGEKILHGCTDDSIRMEAKSRLGFHYCEIGEPNKGKEIFETLPSVISTKEYNLFHALSGKPLLQHICDQTALLSYNLVWNIWRFAMRADLTDQEKLVCMDKMETIVHTIFDDKALDGWYFLLAKLYLEGKAPLSLAMGQKAEALELVEQAASYLNAFENLPDVFKRESLLLQYAEYNKYGDTTDNRTAPQIIMDILAKDCFDPLRGEERFRQAEQMIQRLC